MLTQRNGNIIAYLWHTEIINATINLVTLFYVFSSLVRNAKHITFYIKTIFDILLIYLVLWILLLLFIKNSYNNDLNLKYVHLSYRLQQRLLVCCFILFIYCINRT